MDERPSLRRWVDVRRLLLALAVPWVLIGLAYSGVLLHREVYREGHAAGWMGDAAFVWFIAFGFPGLFSLVAVIILGIYWLATRREYRSSWYGWVWLVLAWANAGVLSTVAH